MKRFLVGAIAFVFAGPVALAAVFTGVSLPVLAAFLVLMNRLQPHLRLLEQSAASLASAAGPFNEVEWLLKMRDNLPPPKDELPFSGLRKAIHFEKVSFEYGERDEPVLLDASFELRRGRSTASAARRRYVGATTDTVGRSSGARSACTSRVE